MTSRRWRWVSARGSADQPFTALNQLQPTYVRCPEGKPSWLPDCLLDQGRNVAEYLAVLPSRDARVIASARVESSVGFTDQKIDGASGCLHSCMHCGEAQGDTMEACVHRMLYARLYNLVWTSFALRTLAC
jgi:hypothetical protein